MRPSGRRFIFLFAALAAIPNPCWAGADEFPTRPVHMISGYAAGGGADVLGRIVGKRMSEILQQQVVMENVTGAGGMVGGARVAKAPPDGYQVLLGSRADAINMTLYKKPLYDVRTELMPVVLLAVQPMILVARPDFPADNLAQAIAHIRKHQDSMKFGSAGIGSTGHLDCTLFNTAIEANITHVPYRGGGQTMQDLMASGSTTAARCRRAPCRWWKAGW
jgi:tripartite-type tricarboxylate transporter receptor subunit TctC